ncbi:MAG: tRNA lysidine(34) synthetase TilS [Firmicutes bacterium]|nr:tRNA lysidine(34) synthetase TilS [Candidatus Fermentithermobacillaceae bacterium]
MDFEAMILNKVRQAIEKYDMIKSGDLVICAVSGGPDSMCLLDSLLYLCKDLNFRVCVGHLHHHMRGEQADKDAELVADFSRSRGIPITIGHADVFGLAKDMGVGVEEAGRIARYKFLFELCEEIGADRIAVGHNMNDQAETVIMRLARGAGTQGLAGISPVKDNVIRPILYLSRSEIEEYCSKRQLPVITDVYNFDLKYTRNLVRHKVIPQIAELLNPSIVETLSNTAEVLRWDAEFLENCATGVFEDISTKEGRVTLVDEASLNTLPEAMSSRVLELAWRECSGKTDCLNVEHVIRLMDNKGGTQSLPEGVTADSHRGYLGFYPPAPHDVDIEIRVPGVTFVPELGLTITSRVFDKPSGFTPCLGNAKGLEGERTSDSLFMVELRAFADYNICGDVIRVRTRKPGDRFKPLGMRGKEKKLQDFLVSVGVSRYYRDFVPIFVCGDRIIWVGGFRLSEEFKVTENTSKILEITVEPFLRRRQNCANI